jgi:hypothetical protein
MAIEAIDVTRESIVKRPARLRRFLGSHPNAPTWFLSVAAFLFGVTLSAAIFVGVWRHTASEAGRARASAKTTAQDLAGARDQITTLQGKIRNDQSRLGLARTALAQLQGKQHALAAKLVVVEEANSRLAARLPGQMTRVERTAGALARESASVASALSALNSYAAQGGSGIDLAYLKLQIQYVVSASARVQATMAELEKQIEAAVSTASNLSNAR